MGTLAQTLGASRTVNIKEMKVNVKQLCLDELFECIRDAFRKFDSPPESIDKAAQEAIETGKIPLTAIPLLIAKACPELDADDIAALTGSGNLDHANKVAAVAMGLSQEDAEGVAPSDGGKKN